MPKLTDEEIEKADEIYNNTVKMLNDLEKSLKPIALEINGNTKSNGIATVKKLDVLYEKIEAQQAKLIAVDVIITTQQKLIHERIRSSLDLISHALYLIGETPKKFRNNLLKEKKLMETDDSKPLVQIENFFTTTHRLLKNQTAKNFKHTKNEIRNLVVDLKSIIKKYPLFSQTPEFNSKLNMLNRLKIEADRKASGLDVSIKLSNKNYTEAQNLLSELALMLQNDKEISTTALKSKLDSVIKYMTNILGQEDMDPKYKTQEDEIRAKYEAYDELHSARQFLKSQTSITLNHEVILELRHAISNLKQTIKLDDVTDKGNKVITDKVPQRIALTETKSLERLLKSLNRDITNGELSDELHLFIDRISNTSGLKDIKEFKMIEKSSNTLDETLEFIGNDKFALRKPVTDDFKNTLIKRVNKLKIAINQISILNDNAEGGMIKRKPHM